MEPTEVTTERVVRELLMNSIGSGGNAKIEVKGVDGWVTAGMVALALLAGVSLYFAADARAEVRALRLENSQRIDTERLSREVMGNWTAQEVTAIRSYITTGKLAPMTTRPIEPPKETR